MSDQGTCIDGMGDTDGIGVMHGREGEHEQAHEHCLHIECLITTHVLMECVIRTGLGSVQRREGQGIDGKGIGAGSGEGTRHSVDCRHASPSICPCAQADAPPPAAVARVSTFPAGFSQRASS